MAWQTKQQVIHEHMTPYDMVKEVVINNARQYNEGLFFAPDTFGDVQDIVFACTRDTTSCGIKTNKTTVLLNWDIEVWACEKYKYLRVLGLTKDEQKDLLYVYDRYGNIWE